MKELLERLEEGKEQVHPFSGAEKKKPTNNYRPAIWQGILGTVSAMNALGQIKYFDYKYNEARAFAGITKSSELRVWKFKRGDYSFPIGNAPSNNTQVLWIVDNARSKEAAEKKIITDKKRREDMDLEWKECLALREKVDKKFRAVAKNAGGEISHESDNAMDSSLEYVFPNGWWIALTREVMKRETCPSEIEHGFLKNGERHFGDKPLWVAKLPESDFDTAGSIRVYNRKLERLLKILPGFVKKVKDLKPKKSTKKGNKGR